MVDLIYRFDHTFGLLGEAHGKSASTSVTNWLIGPAASPSPRAQPIATPTASPAATASAAEMIAPSAPKLTTAERQRIQASVEYDILKQDHVLPLCLENSWAVITR